MNSEQNIIYPFVSSSTFYEGVPPSGITQGIWARKFIVSRCEKMNITEDLLGSFSHDG